MLDIELKIWRESAEFAQRLKTLYTARWSGARKGAWFVPLADAHLRLGEMDEAEALLKEGLKSMPGYRAAMVTLARLYHDQGRLGESRPLLEEVVRRWPDALTAVEQLCAIYDAAGENKKGGAIAWRLRDYYPDAERVATLVGRYEPLPESPLTAPPGERREEALRIKEEKGPIFAPQTTCAHEESALTDAMGEADWLVGERVEVAPEGTEIIDIERIGVGANSLGEEDSSSAPDSLGRLRGLLRKISSVQKRKKGR